MSAKDGGSVSLESVQVGLVGTQHFFLQVEESGLPSSPDQDFAERQPTAALGTVSVNLISVGSHTNPANSTSYLHFTDKETEALKD